jgi:hypothetical protein
MADMLLQAVLFGLATAATPPGILAELTLLGADRGRVKGALFALGIAASVTLATIAGLLFAAALPQQDAQSSAVSSWIGIVVGVAVVIAGVWVWRQPSEKVGGLAGKALHAVDTMPLWLCYLVGMGLVNLVPGFALGAMLQNTAVPPPEMLAVFAVFLLVGTCSMTIPLALKVFAGSRWDSWSGRIRDLAVEKGNALFGIVVVVLGAWFAAAGVLALAQRA